MLTDQKNDHKLLNGVILSLVLVAIAPIAYMGIRRHVEKQQFEALNGARNAHPALAQKIRNFFADAVRDGQTQTPHSFFHARNAVLDVEKLTRNASGFDAMVICAKKSAFELYDDDEGPITCSGIAYRLHVKLDQAGRINYISMPCSVGILPIQNNHIPCIFTDNATLAGFGQIDFYPTEPQKIDPAVAQTVGFINSIRQPFILAKKRARMAARHLSL